MEQYDLLKYVARVLKSLNVPYIVTGSIASIYYGEPRFTNDIDIVIDLEENQIMEFIKLFPKEEFYIDEELIKEAVKDKSQFNIIHPSSGLKIDVVISKNDEFDKERFRRLNKITQPGNVQINLASPEDVIIMKMRYYKEGQSEKHLRDVAGILKISKENINFEYIEKWVEKFKLQEIWREILKKVK